MYRLAICSVASLFVHSCCFGQVTDFAKHPELSEIQQKVESVKSAVESEIANPVPKDRDRLTSLVAKIDEQGPFAFDVEDVKYLMDSEDGRIVQPYFFLAAEVDSLVGPENAKVSLRMAQVARLTELLGVKQAGIRYLLTARAIDLDGLEELANVLTVGNAKPDEDILSLIKSRPLLETRMQDFYEGKHSRTFQSPRKWTQNVVQEAVETKSEPEKPVEGLRTWNDRTGKFSIEAAFAKLEKGVVFLQKADKSIIEVPLSRISFDDQEFIRDQIKARNKDN